MKYWSPTEPNTLRYPKPEGVESFEVHDDFDPECGEVVVNEKGVRVVSIDMKKAAEKERCKLEEQLKMSRELPELVQKIKDAKDLDGLKEILLEMVGGE